MTLPETELSLHTHLDAAALPSRKRPEPGAPQFPPLYSEDSLQVDRRII